MSNTGIVRRIDELGRVVIPKEIRKTLRIKEGDPLEISAEKNELLLKKFSPVNAVSQFSQSICESIKEITDKICYITDTDQILCVAGAKKEVVGKQISQNLEKIIHEKQSQVVSSGEGGIIVPLFRGEETSAENQIIIPIVNSGDVYGSVILCDREKSQRFSSCDVKLVQLVATILSKQFE